MSSNNNRLELDRIIFFSDAVFAIAITLLALNLKSPNDYSHSDSLNHLFAIVLPEFQSYVISFLVIALYWIGHHRYFRYIKRYDYTLVWLNILFLMCIVFLPFSTAVLDHYPERRTAVLFYAVSMALTGLMKAAVWGYAARNRRLISLHLPRHQVRSLTLRTWIPPLVFLVSIPLAYLNASIAEVSWLLILLLFVALRRFESAM